MTGLVSVAGTPLQAKVQSWFDPAARGAFTGASGAMLNSGQAVVTLLRSAVQSMQSTLTEADRRRTETQGRSEPNSQTPEAPREPANPVGQNLDVTA